MIAAINKWIDNSSSYWQGVQLYDQYGSDNFLKMLFKRSESKFNKDKLFAELQKLTNEDLTVEAEPAGAAPDQPLFFNPVLQKEETASRSGPSSDQRPELLKIIKRIDSTYTEMRGLHPYLRILPPGEELHRLAVQIVQLGKQNAELWERRNYINENGVDLPQYQSPAPLKPIMIDFNLVNKREQIRKSLNKAENRLKNQDPKKKKTIALVEARKKDLELMDQQIAEAKEKGAHE